jgi:murein DD-endopeptidase MepM/ murein hydrolase activator NlpD
MHAELAAAQELEQKAAESESARAVLAKQLSEQSDAIQFERDSWQQDRERLHQECRMLGHRLIQKQKEYDSLQEEFQAAAKSHEDHPVSLAQNTITMEQIRDEVAAATQLDEERAAWWVERDQLRQKIDELTAQLAARPEFTQQMTMGPEAIADLQAQARADQEAQQRVATLELELENARCELEESKSWRERADAAAAELEQRQTQNHQLREELASVQRELSAAHEVASVAPAAAVPDEAQLAALNERERQQSAEVQQAREQLAAETEAFAVAKQQLASQQQAHQATQAEFEGRWKLWEENLRRQEDLLQKQADELAQRVTQAESRLAESDSLERAYASREEQLRAEAAKLAELRSELEREQTELAARAALVDSQPARVVSQPIV